MEFGLGTYVLGFLAGVLSILSPCVLPLVPIILASALNAHALGVLALSAGLMLSFTLIGLFVATIGFAIGLDSDWFRNVAAILLLIFGLLLLSTSWQQRFAVGLGPLSNLGESLLARFHVSGLKGQFLVGSLLGVVWAPCVGPTLGAASTLAARGESLPQVAAVMMLFGFGAALPIAGLGAVSRRAMGGMRSRLMLMGEAGKKALGVLMLAIGLMILTGADKRVEAFLVKHSPAWLTDLTVRF